MLAEITAAVQSLRTLGELAKAANSLSNQQEIVMAVSDVNFRLMEAMTVALASQERHSALLTRISDLEKEINDLKIKQSAAEKYSLHKFSTGTFAYRLKDKYEEIQPGHYLCTKCNDTGIHSKLQPLGSRRLKCTTCQTVIQTEADPPSTPKKYVSTARPRW